MKPLVSIIIPVHNAEAYINETIASSLQQSYENIELILVENGSSDESWELINSIDDYRIQTFQLKEGNAAAARNFGYKKSKGDFVKFLDADDLLSSNLVELQVKALKQNPNMLASASWVKFYNMPHENEIQPQDVWEVRDPVNWLVTSWNGGGMMVPGCWMLPRVVIEKAGLWNTSLSLHDDGEFMCRVLLKSQGNRFVSGAILYYRQSENSLSRQNTSKKAARSFFMVCKLYEKAILPAENSPRVRRALARNYARFIYQFYDISYDLMDSAFEALDCLDKKHRFKAGGGLFNRLEQLFGFKQALRIRAFVSSLKS